MSDSDWTVVDRLTLVSEVPTAGAPLVLDEPVWLREGDRYRLDEALYTLIVEYVNGLVRRLPCRFGRDRTPSADRHTVRLRSV